MNLKSERSIKNYSKEILKERDPFGDVDVEKYQGSRTCEF